MFKWSLNLNMMSWHECDCTYWFFGACGLCSWLRHCATSQKVTSLIPDGAVGTSHWCNPSVCTMMILGSFQLLTEMSTRNISLGGKCVQCLGLTTLPHSCADCIDICKLQPPGTHRACQGLYKYCWTYWFCSV